MASYPRAKDPWRVEVLGCMIRFGFDSLTYKDLCVSFGQRVTWHTLVDLVLLLWILEDYGLADGAITERIKTHTYARLHVHCPLPRPCRVWSHHLLYLLRRSVIPPLCAGVQSRAALHPSLEGQSNLLLWRHKAALVFLRWF